HLKTSPITGVHLWYARQVMTEPFLTLLDNTTQWVFNKTVLYRRAETDHSAARPSEEHAATVEGGGQYLQLVISASYDLIPRSRQEVIELCRRELAEVLPLTREAQLRKATGIKEVNATFSPEPGSDRCVRGREFRWRICICVEIGRAPAGLRRWKAQCAADIWPRRRCLRIAGHPPPFL